MRARRLLNSRALTCPTQAATQSLGPRGLAVRAGASGRGLLACAYPDDRGNPTCLHVAASWKPLCPCATIHPVQVERDIADPHRLFSMGSRLSRQSTMPSPSLLRPLLHPSYNTGPCEALCPSRFDHSAASLCSAPSRTTRAYSKDRARCGISHARAGESQETCRCDRGKTFR